MTTFCHIELTTTDLDKAADFYRKLFGWKIEPMMEGYYMISLTDDPDGMSGGLIKVPQVIDSGAQNYVFVESVDRSLAQAVTLGAKVIQEKRALPDDIGFIGMFELPDGFKLGVYSKQ